MKKNVAAAFAFSSIVLFAGMASAQIVPQSNVTVDLTMDAFQSVPVSDCKILGVTGEVSGSRLTIKSAGITFTGGGACPAVTLTSDVYVDYVASPSSSPNISISNINTTSVLGTCNQITPLSGTAGLSGGSASGVIAGTPSPCTFAVVYTHSPAFTSF